MLSPAVFMKLMGVPFNKALKELGVESTVKTSHYTHLPTLYPIVLSDDHTERADELGEAGV